MSKIDDMNFYNDMKLRYPIGMISFNTWLNENRATLRYLRDYPPSTEFYELSIDRQIYLLIDFCEETKLLTYKPFYEFARGSYRDNLLANTLRQFETKFNKAKAELRAGIVNKIKPPLGLIPRKFWIEERIANISNAINRYLIANKPIPPEWIYEYNGLLNDITVSDQYEIAKAKLDTYDIHLTPKR